MSYDYGYGTLGNQMIELFTKAEPDFGAAEALIRQGLDINMTGHYDDENLLSEIIREYCSSARIFLFSEVCGPCDGDACNECEKIKKLNSHVGPTLCAIIRFFLDSGFDVEKYDGCFGAQCLWALTHSTFDHSMIQATKILLDAGAKDREISPSADSIGDTPWEAMASECSYLRNCEHNLSISNIYYAVCEIYWAMKDGRPYSGIDWYGKAIGEKIIRVLAERNGEKPVLFTLDLPELQKENCFTKTIYFVYDGGALLANPYADFRTDTILPEKELVDVSEHFEKILGDTIKQFSFNHKSMKKGTITYVQPIIIMEMDSGKKIKFSVNFGEVPDENRAAFFEITE